MNRNDPIAVVDSGVGGLACLDEIRKAMPGEDIIYFGDTAHMPYGTKSAEEITGYMRDIADRLKVLGAKMIILACGTLSSTVVPMLYSEYPEMLVQGLVDPAAAAVSRACQDGCRVGVIATPRSIESGAYATAFSRLRKQFTVSYKACPELSVYIEKGITEGPEMEELLRSYLDGLVKDDGIEALLFGCTHYPLVSECIHKLYPELKLIDPCTVLAKSAWSLVKVHGFERQSEGPGSLWLLASKKTEGFENMAKRLGFGDTPIEEVSL